MKVMLSGAGVAAVLSCVLVGCSSPPDVAEEKGSSAAAETAPAADRDTAPDTAPDTDRDTAPATAPATGDTATGDTSSNSDRPRTYKYACDIGHDEECGIGGVCRDDGTGAGDCGPIMYCTSDFGCRDGMICVVSNPNLSCFPPDTLDGCGICIDK
jgi:hypothetical protein